MLTLAYTYLLAIYAAVGLAGAPAMDGDFAIQNTRSAPPPVITDHTVPPKRSRVDGLDADIYNGF